MEEYLNKGIKEVITQFPVVDKILEEYGIGCGPCSVGTCLLKDIVDIHNLPEEDQRTMMIRIARVIYPDKVIPLPPVAKKKETGAKELKFSPPMKALVDEHLLIKRWLALIPSVLENLDLTSEEGQALILQGVDFIRSYADRTHHAKEEEVLFNYFDPAMDILQVMVRDHIQGRGYVKAIVEAVDRQDKGAVSEHLLAYRTLLLGHIKKEDEVLFPWMERSLSLTQIGELYSKFQETDRQIGSSVEKFETFITNLEKRFES